MKTRLLLFSFLLLAASVRAAGPNGPFAVETVNDVAYRDDVDADAKKHKLDIYYPKGQKDFPVLFFVHGGTWKSGDRKVYPKFGELYASHGVGTVVISYRLTPQVKHPEHIKDVARAFAWTRANIGKYGGRADQIVACGHSAGGHLVALLATDESYLKAEKCCCADIKAVVAISGVYRIVPVGPLANAFGSDVAEAAKASPVTHVKGQHPPFLVVYADKDLLTLPTMAEEFAKLLKKCDCDCRVVKIDNRDHISIMTRMLEGDDPTRDAVLAFVKQQTEPQSPISAERVKAAVAYLASDRLEGRGPGTRGEILTTEYLADAFKKAGLKPVGDRGSYLQPVPLLRVVTSPQATLMAVKGETTLPIPAEEGFAGTSQTQTEREEFDAEAIFVGHGITAPEFGWDDYRDTDVKGKVVVLFTNEPPSDDAKFFAGSALTYYGRWTYKFEEAARRGAKACFIIHTPATAGYPYSVVRTLDGAQLKRHPDKPALAFAGWLTREAGEKLLNLSGRTVEGALKEADTKGFKPYSLGVHLKGNMPTRIEKMVSHNVAGLAEGSDPTLKAEAVVFTAHWDHLGVGRAVLGDAIYNGAADNATGCGLLLELARAWTALTPRPKRSALFLSVTAEEKGLLGSKFYAENPLVPLDRTALNLNFDMILPLGVPQSVVVTGADRTTAWPTVEAAAKRNGLEIEPDPRAHLGIFYRSDHFSLARAGVPAFSVAAGSKIQGRTQDNVRQAMKEFNDKAYHSPQDDLRPEWDFAGFPVLGRFTLDVARDVANAERLPMWNPGDEFRPAREKRGEK